MSDTIAALASGRIPAGVAVIRISGPQAFRIVDKITDIPCRSQQASTARLMILRTMIDRRVVDHVLRIVFMNPRSFTGEDVVELHVHGGLVVIDEVLELLYSAGARPANPGEFSERAFLNGKLDLTQAEAIADIIAAPTRSARELASMQLGGQLTNIITEVEQQIQHARVLVEASIDFPEDVGDIDVVALGTLLQAAVGDLERLQKTARRGRLLRQGASVVLMGAPNVGKSSLLNVLAGKDRAIVSPIAGTTRDTIDIQIELAGIPITLTDTAGLRESTDAIEMIGIDRTRQSIGQADIVLALESDDTPPIGIAELQSASNVIRVHTKSDISLSVNDSTDKHYVSAETNHGIDALIQGIVSRLLDDGNATNSNEPIAINARHSALITLAIEAIGRVMTASKAGVTPDLLAVDLHDAAFHLANISGRNVIDAMHQEIFSRFCIGK
ncbi:MAG: tRNA uridine-5-carboxymethylaminomethyl(34) synthesis GTPase MnmE [Armatimonadaceae bacterium]